ncbi:hypothetical protein [Bacillus alkalicellulosilyticus]|uniref:hypothetical protein n=1 Tax=Alkalihalobacterium alkalicellulosilyticum TaxID=1912214 RepID=UPI0014835E24|nr:hypothetical protein [Bacillus alkalicellulosilyticus]
MLDKQSAKIYRKMVSANSEYEAFRIAERLSPDLAKRVLLAFIMNNKSLRDTSK